MMRQFWKRFTVSRKYRMWLKRYRWWILVGLTIAIITIGAFIKDAWHPKTGFQGKTVWEWLQLLGVPLTLAVLGVVFQWQEQRRSREEAKSQRKIAADEAKDEILQAYFDRLSALLVDKNLLAIATKIYSKSNLNNYRQPNNIVTVEQWSQLVKATAAAQAQVVPIEQQELFATAMCVVRALTLSVFRRLRGDDQRRSSIIQFLIETEIISKAKLDLSQFDLRGIDLRSVDFSGINLQGAILTGVNLSNANLSGACLHNTNFYKANLVLANLSGACLSKAYFAKVNLNRADLSYASLTNSSLSKASLRCSNLTKANLMGTNLKGADLSGSDLQDIQWSSESVEWKTQWPSQNIVRKAHNVPEKLRQKLGIVFVNGHENQASEDISTP